MALQARRLPQNIPGDFFVDSTCIDCDTCRKIAPSVFRDHGEASSVHHQPRTGDELLKAEMALIACPTASIGTLEKHDMHSAIESFPQEIEDTVYYCGYNSESSFGAWSYLLVRDSGSILVDSPRFAAPLAKKIERMGGVKQMFLTHRDDIADHSKFAERFGCERIMHSADGAARLGVERVINGTEPVNLEEELIAIPTPGHTRGNMILLYKNKYLLTGDHLSWSPERQTLRASKSTCWYSWAEQTRSMKRLLDFSFEWVLPGHGRSQRQDANSMHQHLERLVRWMERQ